jgi:hypothetical protein
MEEEEELLLCLGGGGGGGVFCGVLLGLVVESLLIFVSSMRVAISISHR